MEKHKERNDLETFHHFNPKASTQMKLQRVNKQSKCRRISITLVTLISCDIRLLHLLSRGREERSDDVVIHVSLPSVNNRLDSWYRFLSHQNDDGLCVTVSSVFVFNSILLTRLAPLTILPFFFIIT